MTYMHRFQRPTNPPLISCGQYKIVLYFSLVKSSYTARIHCQWGKMASHEVTAPWRLLSKSLQWRILSRVCFSNGESSKASKDRPGRIEYPSSSLTSSNASFLNSASPAVKLVAVSMVKRDRRVGAQPQGGVAIDTCENPLSQQVKGAMQSGVKLVTRLRRC